MNILLTRYIAKLLLPVLIERGHHVICCIRDALNKNLFEFRDNKNTTQHQTTILAAFGKANEVISAENAYLINAHLIRHPEQNDFLQSADCAIFKVKVNAYQIVLGIADVKWWNIV